MNSDLKFYDFETNEPSNCGEVLNIEVSSHELNWPGVILEKGWSPHFYPINVYTPYFYFALAIEQELSWKAQTPEGMASLKTTPGDIWINPPSTPFTHEIDEPCYFVILAIIEEVFYKNCPLVLIGKDLHFLNNYNVHDEALAGMINLFLMEAQSKGENGQSYLQNLLSLVTTYYINNYSNFIDLQGSHLSASKFSHRELEIVDKFIDKNISKYISIEDLAELNHCSKYYFLREFKKLTGITPYQYLLSKKLDKAKVLLTSPDNTIGSISFGLGFNDQSHFTRAFKNRFGITPGKFQKQSKP